MDADGSNPPERLTTNAVGDLTPTWSPDGEKITFHKSAAGGLTQLFVMNADGTSQTQLTFPPMNVRSITHLPDGVRS